MELPYYIQRDVIKKLEKKTDAVKIFSTLHLKVKKISTGKKVRPSRFEKYKHRFWVIIVCNKSIQNVRRIIFYESYCSSLTTVTTADSLQKQVILVHPLALHLLNSIIFNRQICQFTYLIREMTMASSWWLGKHTPAVLNQLDSVQKNFVWQTESIKNI